MRVVPRQSAFTLLETLVVIAIVGILLGLLLVSIQSLRGVAARLQCASNLRQIGLALHQYHDTRNTLPPGITPSVFLPPGQPFGPDLDRYPLLNWHGRILPFVEQDALWLQIDRAYAQERRNVDIPPHTAALVRVPPYLCPVDGPRSVQNMPPEYKELGKTSYLGIAGTLATNLPAHDTNGVLFLDSKIRLTDITDGTSCTIMVGERPPGFFWPYPGRWYGGLGPWGTADAYLGVRQLLAVPNYYGCDVGPYHFVAGSRNDPCALNHFWSLHPGGANFLFADGSVRFLGYAADGVLPALATRAGGEVISIAY
jgi:prepilin-type processing-associated H-X9-DG protein/prepilin-type N-terminal cleavage/methylation domain-containing protein